MVPQGSTLVDTQYFANLTARINGINVCSELQTVVDEAYASIQAQISAIENQVALLLPIAALLEIPTDLASALSWIEKMVNGLIKPLYVPYATYVAQLAQLIEVTAALAVAIENAAARLKNCSITVPPLTGLVVPPA